MQSPISGSFGGLPPHNQPFRGWQLLGETLVTATSLLLSPTAEVTAVRCDLELQLGFSLVPSSFLFPPFFPPCVLFCFGVYYTAAVAAGVSARVRGRWTISSLWAVPAGRGGDAYGLTSRSPCSAVAQTVATARNPFLPHQSKLPAHGWDSSTFINLLLSSTNFVQSNSLSLPGLTGGVLN